MMRRAVDVFALVIALALVGFGLLAWTRRVDVRACERYEQQLHTLLALDFRLIAEVVKARSGLVAHYDGIVQTEAARKRLHQRLRELPRSLQALEPSELSARLEAGQRSRAETERVVERFKRENAVLRNSLRFLPVLAQDLDAASVAHDPIDVTIASLVRDTLLLQTWQDEDIIARIDRAIAALAAASGDRAQSQHMLATVLAHARTVRARTPVVQELTRSIIARDDTGATRGTMSAFVRQRQAAVQRVDSDASVCFVLTLLALASGAASIILRLRHSTVTLTQTSAELESAVRSLELEQAKQKELAELKSRFVSMASHEFRTPLSVIMSSSEMLDAYSERWPAAKKQEHFGRIRTAAMSMTRMLDATLMIGRRDAGMLKFEPRALEVGHFCSEVLDAVNSATGQGRRLVYRGLANDEQVDADPSLLRHVLENLLSNALKYSPDGSPVELEVAREAGELRFDVRDSGIGISEEDQRHLFESFHRGKNVGSIAGTGLGLAIVRGAVDLHGGSVSLRSELNVGTQFTVRIPCGRSDA